MATEKSITTVSEISNPSATNLSSYKFTMSNSSGTPSLLPGSVFSNTVMGVSTNYLIWGGSQSSLPASNQRLSNCLYFVTD